MSTLDGTKILIIKEMLNEGYTYEEILEEIEFKITDKTKRLIYLIDTGKICNKINSLKEQSEERKMIKTIIQFILENKYDEIYKIFHQYDKKVLDTIIYTIRRRNKYQDILQEVLNEYRDKHGYLFLIRKSDQLL